ncbi:MAG: amidase, partial [Dehalococcoidia bacterium]|nr:amidase [Dehalococcoidia bacterium]
MPSIDDNLAFAPASELREMIGEKQVSPVELTALYYERIDRLDPQLHAYLTLCRDEAMQAAREAESAVMRGDDLGALYGVPISIKDLELTKGVRTTSGSLVFKDRIPDEDSIVVERVKASGAIVLGKTNTPEWGHRGTTENKLGDPCRNPWNTERTPGGS